MKVFLLQKDHKGVIAIQCVLGQVHNNGEGLEIDKDRIPFLNTGACGVIGLETANLASFGKGDQDFCDGVIGANLGDNAGIAIFREAGLVGA